MERRRSQLTIIATSLLGVLASAIFTAAVFILFGAWVLWSDAGPGGDRVATVATVLVAMLTLGIAALAAIAARDEWLGRQRGRMLGLVVALVAVLAVVTILMLGRLHGTEPIFYLGGGLAGLTAVLLVIRDEPAPVGSSKGAVR